MILKQGEKDTGYQLRNTIINFDRQNIYFLLQDFWWNMYDRPPKKILLPDVERKYNHMSQHHSFLNIPQQTSKPQKDNSFSCIRSVRNTFMPLIDKKNKVQEPVNQRIRNFSYQFVVREHINKLSQSGRKGNLQKDLLGLIQIVNGENNVHMLKEKILNLKKESSYFEFEMIESRILFHLILVEIQVKESNFGRAAEELEFCEYHARKENIETFILCFLWELSSLYQYSLNFDKATEAMQNLLEMTIVMGKNRLIRYIYERMSLIYYYRGNSMMSVYYLKKSEEGVSNFEREIYNREYNKGEEISRLETKLFPSQHQEHYLKRKNNPRYEQYVNRQSFQDQELFRTQYVEEVNKMMKNHDSSKSGKFIKNVIRKNKSVGLVKALNQTNPFLRNLPKYPEQTINNTSMIVKTHMSKNRDNMKINLQVRWRKFSAFIKDIFAGIKTEKSRTRKNTKRITRRLL